ncbi:MAG: UvrD-helicase domain-containing protein [Prevotella sp.]|nr:UvrD-helicase domain-containing protein [Prevotella sp.]
MTIYYIIFIICIIVAIILFLSLRSMYKHKSDRMEKELSNMPSYQVSSSFDMARVRLNQDKNRVFDDIEEILEHSFNDHIISGTEEEVFISHFRDIFSEAYSLKRKLEFFHLEPTERMIKLIDDYSSIHNLVKQHNESVITKRLENNQEFFNHCLSYPLDEQQRRSIVSEEDNCLVVSSAGSGKTSSIVGKVKYLLERKGIDPNRILLISYTSKAAAELTDRMGVSGLRGYTFHKLALDLIGKVTGEKPSICENTDALFVSIYHNLLSNKQFQKAVIEYFIDYQDQQEEWEKRKQDRRDILSDLKSMRIKALLPDMDNNDVYVKSDQEKKICFALSSLGIKFRYEEPYEYKVADEMHSQYKPDFSIYYEKNGQQKRIYLEHYAVDEHEMVPLWFAKDKGITYEEANQQYGDGITWKRAAHKKYGTILLETKSADFHYYDIREKLQEMLANAGVQTEVKAEDDLYEMMLPKNSKKEMAFIRLVVTFATLLKSSCKSIQEILKSTYDHRSKFIIKHIFLPVYEQYMDLLKQNGQIDFTDAILWATQLCKTDKPVSYDYIIVDEFQDISVDRYHFLKALRDGNPPAKLFCVGDDWQSIYRFSGSDMALFNHFPDFFGATEINKIETTYRFGEPLVSISSQFIQRNKTQVTKRVHPFSSDIRTELHFYAYERNKYCEVIGQLVATIPANKSIFLLGRYSFDDYYLSFAYQSVKENGKFYYIIGNRKIEFMTVHKSKGLEADYVIILQCNKDIYGFPSMISDDPVLDHVLTKSDQFPYGEERRLFYVAITRAKIRTMVLYDQRLPSVFVNEFLHPDKVTEESFAKHPNANKKWTRAADNFLLTLHHEGKSIKYIAEKMGRSQTSIVMRLGKLGVE